MQSRIESLIEANFNTVVGGAGSWAITAFVMWLSVRYQWGMWTTTNTIFVGCFVWSLGRNYAVRRFFANCAARRAPGSAK